MVKVYIVTDGEYSDYSIKAAFSTEEKANEFIKRMSGRIEVYELDSVQLPKDKNKYSLCMLKDGSIENEVTKVTWEWDEGIKYIFRRGLLIATVWAKDPQHAIKIVNEKRAQLLSQNIWQKKEDEMKWQTIEELQNIG